MLDRAYSILTVKAIDAERRLITGVATSPTADRIGDVVEPLGVTFTNPLPLLLFHDKSRPVGIVRLDRPTKAGVTFEASIPEITEPGTLKDRVDEAWQSLKAKLIRGVSIGFRPLDDGIELLKSGGLRFLKTEILELSLVTVPAHQEALIQTIKSIDAPFLAASGTGEERIVPHSAGVPAPIVRIAHKGAGTMVKTISEQITGLEAKRAGNAARMNEIMQKSVEEGRSTDDAERDEFDTLESEQDRIDGDLKRFKTLEKQNIAAAVPANGSSVAKAGESRGGHISVKSQVPPGTPFTRYAMALAASRGNRMEAVEYAKRWVNDTPEVAMVLKAAVDAGTTTDATWAAPLVVYQNMASEFIELLRPATILGRIPGLRRVPFNISMPSQTAGATANWVGQGKPKAVSELAFTTLSLGMAKAAGIVVLSEELVRSSNPSAEAIVRADLIATISQFLDRQFIDPAVAAVTNVSPAAITNGATVVDSTGTTAAALRADVKSAFATFTAANLSLAGAVWIMTETQALALSMIQNALGQSEYPNITMNGGTLFGLPVIASENVPAEGGSPAGNRIILVKASEILLADDGGVTLDVSREASLQMDSAPTDPPTASTVMVSLWQLNLVGLRAERYINWVRRRTEAVVVIEGAVYTG